MTTDQASTLVQRLQAAFPAMTLSSDTVAKYTAFLVDLPYQETDPLVDEVIACSPKFPTIAEIRRPIIEAILGLPTPEEAYASIYEGGELHPLAKTARDRLGGPWAFKTAAEPGLLRHHFLKSYEELRESELRRANIKSFRRAA